VDPAATDVEQHAADGGLIDEWDDHLAVAPLDGDLPREVPGDLRQAGERAALTLQLDSRLVVPPDLPDERC